MSESTYRSSGDEEPAREARVEALLPATRELLRQACERGEVLASERPMGTGRPAYWLLAAGVVVAGMVALLAGSFGRIDDPPFLTGRAVVVMGVGSLAVSILAGCWLRSIRLYSGGLAHGRYLFASSLIEIHEGRVRVWPQPMLSVSSQRHGAITVELSNGWITSMTRAKNSGATPGGDGETEGAHPAMPDPLHLERGRSEVWRPLPEPTPNPVGQDHEGDFGIFVAVLVLVSVPLSIAAPIGLTRASDSLGITRAVQQRDTRALESYVAQKGPLSEKADDAWFGLIEQDPQARELIAYRLSSATRHRDEVHRRLFAQFPVEADDLLARHLLWQFARGRWEEKPPSRVELPPSEDGKARVYDGYRAPLSEATLRLENYLRDGRPEQPLRPRIEQRLLELRIVESRTAICPPPPRERYMRPEPSGVTHEGEDLLAPYIDQGGARGEQALEARLEQHLVQATRCRSLGDLEKARLLIRTPAQQTAFEAAWTSFFAERRAGISLGKMAIEYGNLTPQEFTLPLPLADPLDALWAYLAAHPETRTRGPWSLRGQLKPVESGGYDDGGWEGLVRMPRETRERLKRASTLPDFLVCLVSPSFLEWDTRHDGPHIALDLIDRNEPTPSVTLEITLKLPGRADRTTRLSFLPSVSQAESFRGRLWGCHRDL